MYASLELLLLKKGFKLIKYDENKTIYNKGSTYSPVILERNSFSFPMKTGDVNYKKSFEDEEEGKKYMENIIREYL